MFCVVYMLYTCCIHQCCIQLLCCIQLSCCIHQCCIQLSCCIHQCCIQLLCCIQYMLYTTFVLYTFKNVFHVLYTICLRRWPAPKFERALANTNRAYNLGRVRVPRAECAQQTINIRLQNCINTRGNWNNFHESYLKSISVNVCNRINHLMINMVPKNVWFQRM